jgi:hypothetical protein
VSRTARIALGALVLVVMGYLAYKSAPGRSPAAEPDAAVATVDAGVQADASATASVEAGSGPLLLADLRGVEGTFDGGNAGFLMPDGTMVPPLPPGAPRQVKFGVVLISYAGAQGAAPSARSHKEALDLAARLAADAKTDFHGAVQRGDSGSADDIGRMPRGVLEPAPEYALFSLPVGGVSEPVDTPRGYWIVKRLE